MCDFTENKLAPLEEIREIYDESQIFRHLGFQIVQFEEGKVIIEVPVENYLINANDTVHGGIYATLLDSIMGVTFRSIVRQPVTTMNLNINYLNPISEGKMIAKAKVIRLGYKTLVGEGEITDESGQLLAKATGIFKVIRK
ncbi:PaaI family thioesterase [Peribacillus sp. NPDC060186]